MRSIDISSVNLSLPKAKNRRRVVVQPVAHPTPKTKAIDRVAEEEVPTPETESLPKGAEESNEKKKTASQQEKLHRIAERVRKRREAKAVEEAAE